MKHKSQFYGISKKIKNAGKNRFKFSEIVKVTIKSNSIMKNMNICYFLKISIPKMHKQSFKNFLKSQNMSKVLVLTELILFILHVEEG